jgi:hypothetical protein
MTTTDTATAVFCAGVELAVVTIYRAAAKIGRLEGEAATVGDLFLRHHAQHAAAFNALLDQPVSGAGNASVVATFVPKVNSAMNQRELLDTLHSLEELLAATHLYNIGTFVDPAAAGTAATILGVEGQHSVVLSKLQGQSPDRVSPSFEMTTGHMSPSTFPA